MESAVASRGTLVSCWGMTEKASSFSSSISSSSRLSLKGLQAAPAAVRPTNLRIDCTIRKRNIHKTSAQAVDIQQTGPGLEFESGSVEGDSTSESSWESHARVYEYTSAANPVLKSIPIRGLHACDHRSGPSRVSTLDLSEEMGIVGYAASSPNLLASFVRVCVGESLTTTASATSQAFYVVHGEGKTHTDFGDIKWKTGDLFVIPGSQVDTVCTHTCFDDDTGGAGLYWVHDSPLLSYLGVVPKTKQFEPTFFSWEYLMANMEKVRLEEGAEERNRMGILLGNTATPQTKTLSHTLWSLLNVLPAGQMQKPHRHSSTALDLAIHAVPGTYTLMGESLDINGKIIDPIRVDWEAGAMFVTPPRWWHSHHNDSGEEAWVLPMQDAGLYTYQRTLDIRFSLNEVQLMKQNILR